MSKEHQSPDSFPMTGPGISDEGLIDELVGGVSGGGNSLEEGDEHMLTEVHRYGVFIYSQLLSAQYVLVLGTAQSQGLE